MGRFRYPDHICNEAARQYDESALAALILWIAMTNVWNRLNVTTKQVAGGWTNAGRGKKWGGKPFGLTSSGTDHLALIQDSFYINSFGTVRFNSCIRKYGPAR